MKSHKKEIITVAILMAAAVVIFAGILKPEATQTKKCSLIYIPKIRDNTNDFWTSVISGCKMAAEEYESDLEILAPDKEENIEEQNKLLKKAIEQKPDAILFSPSSMDASDELLKEAKEKGIHTTIDTAGGPFTREEPFFSKFQELMKYTDLLLVDIKHIDNKYHKVLTGRSNEHILDMIRYLSDIKKPIWIRHVLVPERSDKDEYLTRLADFIHSLDNVEKVEILPYHTMGIYKWKELGLEYPLEGIEPPTKERVENAKKILAI